MALHLHSETIRAFIARLTHEAREILKNEVGFKVGRLRFHVGQYTFPLHIVVFEDNTRLGYFDPRTYTLGFSKKLMYLAHPHIVKNIIRHELAHYIHYIENDSAAELGHDSHFREICRRFGWDPEVGSAAANIDLLNDELESDLNTQKLLDKLKKLLALSASDNPHESELATLKANQLLLEHNLSLAQLNELNETIVYVKKVFEATKRTSKAEAIFNILKTFFVAPIYGSGKNYFYIEAIGDKASVELAHYVSQFLDRELEALWEKAKKQNKSIKGNGARNAFLRGVAQGYVDKISAQKKTMAKSSELVLIQKNINDKLHYVYPRLTRSTSSSSMFSHFEAKSLGIATGKNLHINSAISSKSDTPLFLS